MRNKSFLVVAVLAGCSSSGPQLLSGRVAPGFPVQITEVKALRANAVVATSPVAADGSFQLSVPAGSNLSLRLVGSAHANLVMPRKAGTIATTFSVRAGGVPFDLGAIHYVGSSASTTFSFHDAAGAQSECDDSDHDSTGATCVVDDDGHDSDSCEAADSESESGDEVTAADDNGDDGADDGDAVPEHDFPSDGCAGNAGGNGDV